MSPELHEVHDADRVSQAAHLAAAIATRLTRALERRPVASLVVSGGSTPYLMYAQLAELKLDWPRVQITLADERWVPIDDADSNERQVRASLLRHGAALARFIGLKSNASQPEEAAAAAWAAVGAMPRPVDVVVLGMGEDGHMASLIPGAPELAAGLDERAAPACIAVQPTTAPHARLSLNLAALLQSRKIYVQTIGALKKRVYEKARAAGPAQDMPIRAILRQNTVPVDVYWCPDAPVGEAS
ncbi:MAG TPA: 6-phosphogluconolactonase [Steroidobacteraceae bacterium]|nr:6-phosphogluconolactonase [Steroidobacteraceae bacterium]